MAEDKPERKDFDLQNELSEGNDNPFENLSAESFNKSDKELSSDTSTQAEKSDFAEAKEVSESDSKVKIKAEDDIAKRLSDKEEVKTKVTNRMPFETGKTTKSGKPPLKKKKFLLFAKSAEKLPKDPTDKEKTNDQERKSLSKEEKEAENKSKDELEPEEEDEDTPDVSSAHKTTIKSRRTMFKRRTKYHSLEEGSEFDNLPPEFGYVPGSDPEMKRLDPEIRDEIEKVFRKLSKNQMEIDAHQFLKVLNSHLTKVFTIHEYGISLSRMLVAVSDNGFTGKIAYDEFLTLCSHMFRWKDAFDKHAVVRYKNSRDEDDYPEDNGRYILTDELLPLSLTELGLPAQPRLCKLISIRFGNYKGLMTIQKFMLCVAKLMYLLNMFDEYTIDGGATAEFSKTDLLKIALYT